MKGGRGGIFPAKAGFAGDEAVMESYAKKSLSALICENLRPINFLKPGEKQ
jgi:hypothetical protein